MKKNLGRGTQILGGMGKNRIIKKCKCGKRYSYSRDEVDVCNIVWSADES
jgi:hypothetical protein